MSPNRLFKLKSLLTLNVKTVSEKPNRSITVIRVFEILRIKKTFRTSYFESYSKNLLYTTELRTLPLWIWTDGDTKHKLLNENMATTEPGVNFTSFLRAAFTLRDPESAKKIQLSHQYLFLLSGSASIKAGHRTLMKLSPWSRSYKTFFLRFFSSVLS